MRRRKRRTRQELIVAACRSDIVFYSCVVFIKVVVMLGELGSGDFSVGRVF